jgi:phenol hydroxylase P0 protein
MVSDALQTTVPQGAEVRIPPDDSMPPHKFVRVVERHANGLVRFDFAVGWPDLSCELVLPAPLFDEFCRRHAVEFMTEPADAGINALPASEPR